MSLENVLRWYWRQFV